MGRGPARPRTPMQSIGAIGSTTLAPAPNGGGHDALLQRLIGQGGTEWANPTVGKVIAYSPDDVTVTGAGTFGFNEFLVDTKWNDGQPCHVVVTVSYTGTYADQPVDPPTDPATYIKPPELLVQLIDGSTGRETTFGPTFEIGYGSLVIGSAKSLTVAWTFLRGRPKLQVSFSVSAAQAPGIGGTPELIAIARITPL